MAPDEQLPNFFVIGAMKSGTSSLAAMLGRHPDVSLGSVKEPGYFVNDELYGEGLDAYAREFYRKASGVPARGDATPTYLYSDRSARRIHRDLDPSHHRFILLLRDPVKRAHSHYQHLVRIGVERRPFAACLDDQAPSPPAGLEWVPLAQDYICASRYALHLRRWQSVFPDAPPLVLTTEELIADPEATMARVTAFLGLASSPKPVALDRRNPNSRSRTGLVPALHRAPGWLRRSGNLLRPTTRSRLFALVRRMDLSPTSAPDLAPQDEQRLRELLDEDVVALEGILGRDLSVWRSSPASR